MPSPTTNYTQDQSPQATQPADATPSWISNLLAMGKPTWDAAQNQTAKQTMGTVLPGGQAAGVQAGGSPEGSSTADTIRFLMNLVGQSGAGKLLPPGIMDSANAGLTAAQFIQNGAGDVGQALGGQTGRNIGEGLTDPLNYATLMAGPLAGAGAEAALGARTLGQVGNVAKGTAGLMTSGPASALERTLMLAARNPKLAALGATGVATGVNSLSKNAVNSNNLGAPAGQTQPPPAPTPPPSTNPPNGQVPPPGADPNNQSALIQQMMEMSRQQAANQQNVQSTLTPQVLQSQNYPNPSMLAAEQAAAANSGNDGGAGMRALMEMQGQAQQETPQQDAARGMIAQNTPQAESPLQGAESASDIAYKNAMTQRMFQDMLNIQAGTGLKTAETGKTAVGTEQDQMMLQLLQSLGLGGKGGPALSPGGSVQAPGQIRGLPQVTPQGVKPPGQ